jgi:lipid II:glycine glycyltransferase (peptidoglycan interpeptide bridge formation enzyme)
MGKLTITLMDHSQIPSLNKFKDHTIFQTSDWMRFISHSQNTEPVVAVVKNEKRQVGRFSGQLIKKYGLRILGSPFPGWTTSYMGFNLDPSVSRFEALRALDKFAFRELKCVHIEIMDRHLRTKDFEDAGYRYKLCNGFEIDLTRSEEELFGAMKSACRRCIRRAAKLGVKIEKANDISFADNYYAQLKDVFARQNLVPTYPIERVRSLIKFLLPTDKLLLVRAKNSEGNCIASGIFPAQNDTMHFWGGASWRHNQSLRPNEAIQWFAMRYWKYRGIRKYDMGGGGEYKRKYGGNEIAVPWGRKSMYPVIENFRNFGNNLFVAKQRLCGKLL